MRKFVVVLIGLIALGGCGYEVSFDSESGLQGNSIDMTLDGYGFIEGGLSYPSEEIPSDLRVCVENEKGSSCGTYELLEGDEFKYGVGYQVEVPVGTYMVFSKAEASSSFNPVIGGYTQCGDASECEDHKLLMVEVLEGEKVEGIDLYDFQAEFY